MQDWYPRTQSVSGRSVNWLLSMMRPCRMHGRWTSNQPCVYPPPGSSPESARVRSKLVTVLPFLCLLNSTLLWGWSSELQNGFSLIISAFPPGSSFFSVWPVSPSSPYAVKMRPLHSLTAVFNLISLAFSHLPPPPKDVITVQSKFNNGITISYKEVPNDGALSWEHQSWD